MNCKDSPELENFIEGPGSHKSHAPYNLRAKDQRKLPSVSSLHCGMNSPSRGGLLWNALGDDLNLTTSLIELKKEISHWDGSYCTCNICTVAFIIF